MELAGKLLPASLAFERTGHAGFGFVYRFKNGLLHFLKDRAVCVDVLVQKTGQPEYLAVGRGFLHNRLNLFGNALNFLIDDEGFAFVKNPHQADRPVENFKLVARKEFFNRLVILGKVQKIITPGIDGREKFIRVPDGQNEADEPFPGLDDTFAGILRLAAAADLQLFQLGFQAVRIFHKAAHQRIVFLACGADAEQLFHNLTDGFFLLLVRFDPFFGHKLFIVFLAGQAAEKLVLCFCVQRDGLVVDIKRNIAAFEKPGNKPLDIRLNEAVGGFGEAVEDGFHGSF